MRLALATVVSTSLTNFMICINLLEESDKRFKWKHPPAVTWPKPQEIFTDMQRNMMIWAKLDSGVDIYQRFQVLANINCILVCVILGRPVRCCPANCHREKHGAVHQPSAEESSSVFRGIGARPKLRERHRKIEFDA